MTLLARVQAGVARALSTAGTTCVVQQIAATYATDTGAVTETPTSHTVACTDLFDETQQMDAASTSTRAVASMIVNGSVAFTPEVGNLVVYQTRNFEVLSVQPIRVGGGVGAYQLNLAELGAA